MRHISPTKTALAVGSVFAIWHTIWVTLVGVGWAKPVMDFVLRLHFIEMQYSLAPFSVTTAEVLIVVTFVIGAFLGLVFAIIWNWLTFGSAPEWARDSKPLAPMQLGEP
jgi:fatty acid desaturase